MSAGLQALADATIPPLILQIVAIDGQLETISMLMSRLQPWHTGRVGVVMENESHNRTTPSPREFYWNSKMRKWNSKRFGAGRLAQRVKRKGAFDVNHEVVKELATQAMFLLGLRTDLVTSFMLFRDKTEKRLKTADVLSEYAKVHARLHQEISEGKLCTDFSSWRTDPAIGTEGS